MNPLSDKRPQYPININKTTTPQEKNQPPCPYDEVFYYDKEVKLQVVPFPVESEIFQDVIYLNSEDFRFARKHIWAVIDRQGLLPMQYYYDYRFDDRISLGQVALSAPQRMTLNAKPNTILNLALRSLNLSSFAPIKSLVISISFNGKLAGFFEIEEEDLKKSLQNSFKGHVLNKSQILPIMYKGISLLLQIDEIVSEKSADAFQNAGIFPDILPEIVMMISSKHQANLRINNHAIKNNTRNISLNFKGLGIGGLEQQLEEVLTRAFLTRVLPADDFKCYGAKHAKGVLLYGPPGTGKTLIARTIANMFGHAKVTVVNGPELLSKYVGQSEEHVRSLFKAAEAEYKEKKDDSDLHIIIFDEIDAICKKRGQNSDGTGVGDNIVNQLLTKMDGVEELNNILVIGMTNRKDLIDEAFLRPGRMEVLLPINLPDAKGRLEILEIHTSTLREHDKLDSSVDLNKWAELTSNFSGADLEGLVRSAIQNALPRNFENENGKKIVPKKLTKQELAKVTEQDFQKAFEKSVPSFGISAQKIDPYIRNNLLPFNPETKKIMDIADRFFRTLKQAEDCPILSILLAGDEGVGKTTMAAELAMRSQAPYVSMIEAGDLAGKADKDRISHIESEFNKAYQSKFSVIILDNLEGILAATPDGHTFSNQTLIKLQHFLKSPPKNKMMVIATTCNQEFIENVNLDRTFKALFEMPKMETEDVVDLLWHLKLINARSITDVDVSIPPAPIGDVMLFIKTYLASNEVSDNNNRFNLDHFLTLFKRGI